MKMNNKVKKVSKNCKGLEDYNKLLENFSQMKNWMIIKIKIEIDVEIEKEKYSPNNKKIKIKKILQLKKNMELDILISIKGQITMISKMYHLQRRKISKRNVKQKKSKNLEKK